MGALSWAGKSGLMAAPRPPILRSGQRIGNFG